MILSEFVVEHQGESLQCVLAQKASNGKECTDPVVLIPSCRTGWDSLYVHPYNLTAQKLLEAGYRVATFMVPYHGDRIPPHAPSEIAGFAHAVQIGEDPFAQYVSEAQAVVSEIINLFYPRVIYTFGGSRTGYLVLRHAAQDPRVQGVSVISPVTDWRRLKEFTALGDIDVLRQQPLIQIVESLKETPISIRIGNHDTRVNTESCIDFYSQLISRTHNSKAQLHVVEADDHSMSDEQWIAAGEFLVNLPREVSPQYVRESPFKKYHRERGASLKAYQGWYMPQEYITGVQLEKDALSRTGGFIDMRFRGLIWIRGEHAYQTVVNIFGEHASELSNGRGLSFDLRDSEDPEKYSAAMLYAYSRTNYCVRVDYQHREKFFQYLQSQNTLGAIIEDHSSCFSTIGVYGAQVEKLLSLFSWSELPADLSELSLKDLECEGRSVIVERTNNQIGQGYEISGNAKDTVVIWDKLTNEGSKIGFIPVGLKAALNQDTHS